jgi:hypothetical protein
MREIFETLVFAGGIGIACGMAWLLLILLAAGWRRAMAWVDDREDLESIPNPLIAVLMKRKGYTWQDTWKGLNMRDGETWWRWCKPGKGSKQWDTSDADGAIATSFIVVVLAPIVATAAFLFYPIAIAAGLLVLIAHIARFAKRHKKLFDKHIKDPLAHKAEDTPIK